MNPLPPPSRHMRQPAPRPRPPLHLRHVLWLTVTAVILYGAAVVILR